MTEAISAPVRSLANQAVKRPVNSIVATAKTAHDLNTVHLNAQKEVSAVFRANGKYNVEHRVLKGARPR